MIELPAGIVTVQDLSTLEVLYGSRETQYRYELLTHNTTTGVDQLAGYLDGVTDGSLRWQSGASVKKGGSLRVVDLAAAAAGATRVADVNLVASRIRPVLVVEGLPDQPLGAYLITAAPEGWSGTGREYTLELHDRCTVLDQDKVDGTYTAATGTPILTIIKSVVNSAGEAIDVDASDARQLSKPMVWPAGTTKLKIVNELLDVLGYNSLWMDGSGALRATAYVRPALRAVNYAVLNDADGNAIPRELVDGDLSIYSDEWSRVRDSFNVPNKVVAVAAGGSDAPPPIGTATNTDASSPYSYAARGNRWIVMTLDGVELPDYSGDPDPTASAVAFLTAKARQALISASAVQASVSVKCLPIPVELLDALRFASTPAGVNARHTVVSVQLDLRFDGLMGLELREVIDL